MNQQEMKKLTFSIARECPTVDPRLFVYNDEHVIVFERLNCGSIYELALQYSTFYSCFVILIIDRFFQVASDDIHHQIFGNNFLLTNHENIYEMVNLTSERLYQYSFYEIMCVKLKKN